MNTSVQQNTRFLRTRTPFKRRSCYSPTSSQVRVLVALASIVGYLQDSPSSFFSYGLLNTRKWRNHYQWATYQDNFSHVLNQEFLFFGSRVARFASNPSCLKYWLLCPFSYKEATCEGSTGKGLPYAAKAVPAKDYFMHMTLTIARKGHWVISPNYRASHPRHFCAVGDVVAQRYDVLCDWLWDTCHMAGVHWGSRCEGFSSKEGPHYHLEWGARKLSEDKQQSTLITSLEIPWGFHTQAVLRSLARPRSRKKVSVWGFLRERKVWFVFSPTDHQTPSAKGGKGKIHQ